MRTRWLVAGLLVLVAVAGVWALSSRDGRRAGEAGGDPARPVGGGDDPSAVDWSWSVVVDSGGGHVGPWRMNRSDWRYVDDPTVALDAGGEAVVAWVDQSRKDVMLQRYGPEGRPILEAPVNVSRSPGVFSWLPRVVVAPGRPERVYVLWQEIVFSGGTHGGEAFFARSSDGGRSFAEPLNLSNTPAGAGKGRLTADRWHNGSLDLAPGPDGAVYAAWTVYEGSLWAARSADGGTSFAAPVRVTVADGAEPARAPSLAVGPEGTVHLAWALGGDPGAGLRYATSGDGGRSFGEPAVLFEAGGHADAPKLAVDGGARVHLVWAQSPPDRAGAHAIRYARAPAGAGFGAPRDVAIPGSEGLAGVHFPSLDLDGEGDPWIVWERFPEGAPRSRGLGIAASPDGGASFAPPAVVPGSDDPAYSVNGSLQGLLMRKLSVNAEGAVVVVNSSIEPGAASRVRLVRGRAPGR